MSSKRYNKMIADKNQYPETFSKLISEIKKNCTAKFDESIDLSFQIVNKQKKNEINIRTAVNMPSGTGKKTKIAVVAEEPKQKDANGPSITCTFSPTEYSIPLWPWVTPSLICPNIFSISFSETGEGIPFEPKKPLTFLIPLIIW